MKWAGSNARAGLWRIFSCSRFKMTNQRMANLRDRIYKLGSTRCIYAHIEYPPQKWREPSKQPVSLPVEKHQGSSSQLKLHVRVPRPPVAWRSPIVTGPVQSRSERFVVIRNPPSCWSASCPSSVWWEKSPRTSRPTCASRALPSELCRWEPRGSLSCMLINGLSVKTWESQVFPGEPRGDGPSNSSLFLSPCRRPARPTWWVCSRTPTCAPSTPRGSPSCPKTSSWPAVSAENAPKRTYFQTPKRLFSEPPTYYKEPSLYT